MNGTKSVWLFALSSLPFLLLPMPALAQDISPDLRRKITGLLDTAIAEQTLFLNCFATIPTSYPVMESAWVQSVTETIPVLLELGFDAGFIDDFIRRSLPATMQMPDRPFAEVIALCNADPDWEKRAYRLDYVLLPLAINKAITDAAE